MVALSQVLARNLLYHRKRLGLTQAQLAEMVDTTPSYIGHLERGEREPSLLTIQQLAGALSLWAGELFVTRTSDQERGSALEELRVLLMDRPLNDVSLAIRLARAAFEDPRLTPRPEAPQVESKKRPSASSTRKRKARPPRA